MSLKMQLFDFMFKLKKTCLSICQFKNPSPVNILSVIVIRREKKSKDVLHWFIWYYIGIILLQ